MERSLFRAMTHNSARRVSKTGFAGPQISSRQRTRSPQRLQLLRKEPVDLKDNGFRESEMLRQKRENAKA